MLQLEPHVVGLRWHSWIRPSWPHPDRSGPHAPRHPHHRVVTGGRHPLRPHVAAHRRAVEAAVGRHAAVAWLAAVVLTVHERLHAGRWVRGAQVLVLL